MILFTIDDLFTKDVIWWGWQKKPKIQKRKQEKNTPFGYPPIPPSTKWRPTVFRCPKTLQTSRTYPKWVGVPNLMGQKKIQGWVRYGQLIADNMIFIHMKFQDLQQNRAGVWLEVQKPICPATQHSVNYKEIKYDRGVIKKLLRLKFSKRYIVGQTVFYSFGEVTRLGKGKQLNSKGVVWD